METFKKCIHALRHGKTDNEKLAALMVISKITHTINLDKKITEDLYKAVSKTFLLRLLKSSTNPDENSEMFHQLALTILSIIAKVNPGAFASDQEILKQLVDELQSHMKRGSSSEDLLELLTMVSEDSIACKVLVDLNILDVLCSDRQKQSLNEKESLLIKNLLMNDDSCCFWNDFMVKRSEILVNNQELEKFHTLSLITELVDIACDRYHATCKNFKKEKQKKFICNIVNATEHVLRSRIKAKYKQTMISLLAGIVKMFGLKSLLKETGDKSGFILLILTTISVEISFLFDLETPIESLIDLRSFISQSFFVCRSFLNHICSDEFEEDNLATDSKFIVHVFETFKAIMTSVYCLLKSCPSTSLDNPILYEALIMMCVWATEETESLQEELRSNIPLLIKVGEYYLKGDDIDLMNGLMTVLVPCVSQLLPDDGMRKILNKTNCVSLLQQYTMKSLATETSDTSNTRNPTLECLIHFYHELIILSPKYCNSVTWPLELKNGLVELFNRSTEQENYHGISQHSLLELMVILLRLPLPDMPLDDLLPKFFKELILFGNEIKDFDRGNCEEIWHIGMQAVTMVITTDVTLRQHLRGNKDVRELLLDDENSEDLSKSGKEFLVQCKKLLYG